MSYSPLCIRNTTSKQVPSGFLRFSIKDKINLKEKNLIKIKRGNHETLGQKNYQECTTLPA